MAKRKGNLTTATVTTAMAQLARDARRADPYVKQLHTTIRKLRGKLLADSRRVADWETGYLRKDREVRAWQRFTNEFISLNRLAIETARRFHQGDDQVLTMCLGTIDDRLAKLIDRGPEREQDQAFVPNDRGGTCAIDGCNGEATNGLGVCYDHQTQAVDEMITKLRKVQERVEGRKRAVARKAKRR